MSSFDELSNELTKNPLEIEKSVWMNENPLQSYWVLFKESEVQFIDFMKDKPFPINGNLECSPTLPFTPFPETVVGILNPI